MQRDKKCPACNRFYKKSLYRARENILYKYYIHDSGECEEYVTNFVFGEKKVLKKVIVDYREKSGIDKQTVQNILEAFCESVETAVLEEGDIWFPEVDLVVELKKAPDLVYSMYEGRLDDQSFRMPEKHAHAVICCIGSPTSYVLETSEYSTVDYLTRIKQIHGYWAYINMLKIENFAFYDDEFCACYWAVSYAKNLLKLHKEDKVYFLKRIDIPKREETSVSIYRCIDGIDTEKARRIYEKFKTPKQILENPDGLESVKGIGPKLKRNIIDALGGAV